MRKPIIAFLLLTFGLVAIASGQGTTTVARVVDKSGNPLDPSAIAADILAQHEGQLRRRALVILRGQ